MGSGSCRESKDQDSKGWTDNASRPSSRSRSYHHDLAHFILGGKLDHHLTSNDPRQPDRSTAPGPPTRTRSFEQPTPIHGQDPETRFGSYSLKARQAPAHATITAKGGWTRRDEKKPISSSPFFSSPGRETLARAEARR